MTQDRFILPPFTRAHIAQVVDLVNAEAAQTIGIRRAVVDAVGQIRLIRYVPPLSPKVVIANGQDQIVGYAYLADREQRIVYEVGGAVQPAYWGQGLGTQLIQWAEEKALNLSQHAPAGVRTVLQTNLFEAEVNAQQLFAQRGFTRVRDWLHLKIDLKADPSLPKLPDGVSIRAMDLDNDWDSVGPAMDEAFVDHWGSIPPLKVESHPPVKEPDPVTAEPQDDSYSNAPGFCFIALDQDQVIGGILCNAKLVERSDTGRVGSLFVRPAYRRQRIGQALMHTAFQAFWQHGLRRIILDTDAESFSQTPKFYSQLGLRFYRRELLYEKEIRPGREVRRLQK